MCVCVCVCACALQHVRVCLYKKCMLVWKTRCVVCMCECVCVCMCEYDFTHMHVYVHELCKFMVMNHRTGCLSHNQTLFIPLTLQPDCLLCHL